MTRNVLVLCTGNMYRSPLAGAIIKSERPQLMVKTAGFGGSGHRAGKPIREAAEALGLDLSEHRSVTVDKAAVEWADVVLVMSDVHIRRLREFIGYSEPKKHQEWLYLGVFHEPPLGRIPDPGFMKRGPKLDEVVNIIVRSAVNAAHAIAARAVAEDSEVPA